MFVNFSEDARHILKQAQKEKEELNHPYIGSEHLMLSILKEGSLKELLNKYGITYLKFREKLISLIGIGTKKMEFNLYTPMLKKIIQNAIFEAREDNLPNINPDLLFITILDEQDGVAYSVLRSMKINLDRLYNDIRKRRFQKSSKKKKLLIEEIGVNLTKQAKLKKIDPVIGRDKEIEETINILLRRKKNNPILLGPAGVGKTAIVEGIVNLMVSDKCPSYLKNKNIISLNIFAIVSGTKYRGEFEEKMKTIIKELEENEDIILFIDEIHTIVGAGGAEGAIDASNIFKPALARGTIKIIGATTLDEYKKFIEPDAALSRRFQKILIEEPSKDNLIKILTEIKPLYESYHNIKVPKEIINDIVELSNKYLTNRYEPDRSIDILDEVCVRCSNVQSYEERKKQILLDRVEKIKKEKIKSLSNNDFNRAYKLKEEEKEIHKKIENIKFYKKIVSRNDVVNTIKQKGNLKIDVDCNKEYYKKLESNINNLVIGQEDNVHKLINSLRVRNNFSEKRVYSILISGTKGSGKTYLANIFLKQIMNEKNIINLDLSEYKEYHTISKLIGTTAGYLGYYNKNNVFEKIRSNPSMALIVDNFDKACSEVKNLFYKILENGYIEDAATNKIDFTNAIIIFNVNEKESKKLGFSVNGINSEKIHDKLFDNVLLNIKLNTLDLKEKEKIVRLKINNIIDNYSNVKVIVKDNYIKDILNRFEKETSLYSICSYLYKNMNERIANSIMNDLTTIEIDCKKKENVKL